MVNVNQGSIRNRC